MGRQIHKLLIAIITLLCLGIGLVACMFYWAESTLSEIRKRATDNLAESESYSAWYQATRWSLIEDPLKESGKLPINKTLSERTVWIRSYKLGDSKPAGISLKYHNNSYAVYTLLRVVDFAPEELFSRIFSVKDPKKQRELLEGTRLEYYLNMRCKTEKIDAPGEWYSSEYSFSITTGSQKTELFQKIKAEK